MVFLTKSLRDNSLDLFFISDIISSLNLLKYEDYILILKQARPDIFII